MADALAAGEQRVGELLGLELRRSATRCSNHSIELRAADWRRITSSLRARLVARRARSGRRALPEPSRPGRSRPPSPAASPSRSRSGPCARRRPSGRRCRGTSARSGCAGSAARSPSRAGGAAFERSRAPCRKSAKSSSQCAIVSSASISAKPSPSQVSGRALDDHGRGLRLELVGVDPDRAVLGVLEDEREGVELAVGAEPDEAVGPQVDVAAGSDRRSARGRASWRRRRRRSGRSRRARRGRRPRASKRCSTPSSAARCCRMFEQPLAARSRRTRGRPSGSSGRRRIDVDVVPVGEVARGSRPP